MAAKKARLGMSVEGKKPSPYTVLSGRMLKGQTAQQKLEKQGRRKITRTGFEEEIVRSQEKLPRVKPSSRKPTTKI